MMVGGANVASYDIACVTGADGAQGAGAAILFFVDKGVFNVIAHEGDIVTLQEAMSTRDRLSQFLIR